MSGDLSIKAFEERSRLAEEKIQYLQKYLATLQQRKAAASQELFNENARLKQRVADLKLQLRSAEILNGKPQIPLPGKNSASGDATQTVEEERKPAPAKPAAKIGESDQKKPKKEKSKAQPKAPKEKKAPPAERPVDVSRLDMRVAQIVSVQRHPDADTLYLEQINVGEAETRQVVTGVVKFVPIEEMENRMVIIMCNLKPAKMRGILSQAMVMCANAGGKLEILDPPAGAVPGDRIVFEAYPGTPDTQLNPKKKVWEKIQPDLSTNADCVACYKGEPWMVAGKGPCTVKSLTNCGIK